jgi:RimJ/RimL family protein N-acetyltransferase
MPSSTPTVELVAVDEGVLAELVALAKADAAPDEVTPPLGDGWTPERVAWLESFHRDRLPGLPGVAEETAAICVNGRIVGATRLHRSSPDAPQQLECGIWLARSARGHGVSAAVVRLLVDRATDLGASHLIARTTARNAPAVAALRRFGAILSEGGDGSVHAEIRLDGEGDRAEGDDSSLGASSAMPR